MENATLNPEEELQKFRVLVGDTPEQSTQTVNQPPPVTASGVVDANVELQKFRDLTSQMPNSQNAVNQVRGVSVQSALSLTEREGRKDAAGELIPISNEGIGAKYFRAALQRGPEAQLAVIQKMYPDKNARILESGKVSVELIDSTTGKPKDVIINPEGLEIHDLADLVVQMPEIAAGTAMALAFNGTGLAKTVGQIIFSSLASAEIGAFRDIAARTAEGIPVNLSEIAQSRGSDLALDMFLQTSMLGVAKATRAASPFMREIKPDSLQFDLQAGRRFFKQEFGEDISQTPAEITGSPALSAIEAAEGPQPGWRTVLTRIREKKNEQIQRIQARAGGTSMPEEAIGEQAIGTLRNKIIEPLENALEQARTVAEQKSNKHVLKLIDDATGLPQAGRVTPSVAGAKTLEEFEAKLATAESNVQAAYKEVNALPGGSGDILPGDAAASAAAEIRKEIPQVATTKETIQYDQYGNPMTKDVPTKEVLTSGVPEGLLKALSDLEKLKGGKVSLQTLTNMKRSAYDAIAAFKTAHGDVKDRWFKKIAGAYEQGIQEGIDSTQNLDLKNALVKAKNTYKNELLPFERPGLKEMAKDEFDPGQLSHEQIARRLFEGPNAIKNFGMLKEVLGANNPAFRVLKRAWADTQLADVSDNITGSVNAKGLADKIHQLTVDTPELATEMFGKNHRELAGALRVKAGLKNLNSLDVTEVKTLLSLKDPTVADLNSVLKMQKIRDTAYANSILKDIAAGLPIASDLKPGEFVKRLTNASTPTKDVEQVLGVLAMENPEAREAVATATFYKLLNEASISEAATASRSVRGQPINLSAVKLAQALGPAGSPQRLRYELLMGGNDLPITPPLLQKGKTPLEQLQRAALEKGPTRLEVLENLVKVLAPGEVKSSKAFASMGGMSGGVAVQQAIKEPTQYASTYAQKFLLATIYTLKPVQKLVTNRAFGPAETAALANTLIASEPFVRRATEVMGDESMAASVIGELKDSIDRYVSELANSPQSRDRAELGKFMRGEPAKMTVPR